MWELVIPFLCGDPSRRARSGVFVHHGYTPELILLVTVENQNPTHMFNLEARIMAVAIASFQTNNKKRREKGIPPLHQTTFPAITMSGTHPTFYLIPVSQELSDAVVTGQYPANEPQVFKCATISEHIGHENIGMEDMEYRRMALQHFLAFKTLAKCCWDQMFRSFDVECGFYFRYSSIKCNISLCS
jgi:hypothetical protein